MYVLVVLSSAAGQMENDTIFKEIIRVCSNESAFLLAVNTVCQMNTPDQVGNM